MCLRPSKRHLGLRRKKRRSWWPRQTTPSFFLQSRIKCESFNVWTTGAAKKHRWALLSPMLPVPPVARWRHVTGPRGDPWRLRPTDPACRAYAQYIRSTFVWISGPLHIYVVTNLSTWILSVYIWTHSLGSNSLQICVAPCIHHAHNTAERTL